MVVGLGTNISALRATNALNRSIDLKSASQERLSSGLRINRASDDAAGLAIATSLNVDARVYGQGIRNVNDAVSLLNIADGATRELSGILIRLKELATQSSNGTYGNSQRTGINNEAQALRDEFNRIIETTKFNGVNLLDGTNSSISIQAGGNNTSAPALAVGIEQVAVSVTGDGTFSTGLSIGAGTDPNYVRAADLNGDGAVDIFGTVFGDDRIVINYGNGDGTFKARVSYATGDGPYDVQARDFNGDGKLDLASVGGFDTELWISLANSDGTFKAPVSYVGSTTQSPNIIVTGDFNGDGNPDIAVSNYDNYIYVYHGNSDGTFKAAATYLGTTGSLGLESGDFNGDGFADLISTGNFAEVSLLLGNSNGTFKFSQVDSTVSNGLRMIGTGDLNGDGNLDFVASGTTNNALYVYLGQGNGTFQAEVSYGITDPWMGDIADFNDDGVLDLVAASGSTNSARVFLGNGNGTFKASTSYTVSAAPVTVVAADFNSDGVDDLVATGTTGDNFTILNGNTRTAIRLRSFSLSTRDNALSALSIFDSALNQLSLETGRVGAQMSRLQTELQKLSQGRINFQAAESRIKDIDVASESAHLVRTSILEQTGAAVLSQANRQPDLVLKLLQ